MFGGKDNFGGKGPFNTTAPGGYGAKGQPQTNYGGKDMQGYGGAKGQPQPGYGGKEMQKGAGYAPKAPYDSKTQGGYAGKGDPYGKGGDYGGKGDPYGKGSGYDEKAGHAGQAAAGSGGLARMGMSPAGVNEVMSGRLPSQPSDQYIALAILRSVN